MTCIFDENLPPRISKAFNELEGRSGVQVKHLREMFPPATKDIEWINELSKIDGCFIITKDRNIKRNPHEFLAWQESGLPIVFMKKGWKDQSFWDLSWKLLRRWDEIKTKVSRGKSLMLPINGKIEEI